MRDQPLARTTGLVTEQVDADLVAHDQVSETASSRGVRRGELMRAACG
jgi:hypothetical protein